MLSDDDFLKLLQFLDRPWAGYRKVRKGVKKRVRRHMALLGCAGVAAYLEILRQHPDERRRCEQALLVTISRFFRDRRLWQVLGRRILPGLIIRFKLPIRIWSAGCASGEEAYSLAMAWAQLPDAPALNLLATDVRGKALHRARQGVYRHSSLKELPARERSNFFRDHGPHHKIVQIQQLPPIRWLAHNLLEPPPADLFHMILLRNNLLTYYQGPALTAALQQLVAPLAPGGFLVTGSHEGLPQIEQTFARDPACPWIYRLETQAPATGVAADVQPGTHPSAG